MELRDLRSFAAVARTGSFTAAAVELGYTQSAVSQHIAALEREVGRPLLSRRPVALTDVGRRLAEHAAHIVLRLDVARSELATIDAEPVEIRVVTTPLADTGRLARALLDARPDSPYARMRVRSATVDDAVAAVAAGECDLALVDGIVATSDPLALSAAGLLRSFIVGEDDVVVVVPTGHPLRATHVDLATVVDARWIHAPDLDLLPDANRTAGSTSVDGTDVVTLLELVAAGHGLTVLPRRVCEHVDGVRLLALRQPALVHRTELLVLRTTVERHGAVIAALRR